jgi:hypothetical protein
VAPVEGSQDCAWLPDGRLLMARGTTIYAWSPAKPAWAPLIDFAQLRTMFRLTFPEFTNITRLAASPDGQWLALVADPVAK